MLYSSAAGPLSPEVPHAPSQAPRGHGLHGHTGSSGTRAAAHHPGCSAAGPSPRVWRRRVTCPTRGHSLASRCDRCGLNWRHQDPHPTGAKTILLALTLLLAAPWDRATRTLQKDPSGARRRLQLKGPLLSDFEEGPTTSDPVSRPRQPGGRPQEGGCGQNK